jgi:hypothetical protein
MFHLQGREQLSYFGHLTNADDCCSWLYTLMVAMDANFRLRSKLRGLQSKDPTLTPGWAYFVNNGSYADFIKDYVDQDEVRAAIA